LAVRRDEKFACISSMILDVSPPVIALVETHLLDGDPSPFSTEGGYQVHRMDRDHKATRKKGGGGVIVAVRNCFVSDVVGSYQGLDIEALAVRVLFPVPTVFVVAYRPPDAKQLTEGGRDFLELACRGDSFLLGDFNFDPRTETPSIRDVFRYELALTQCVDFPTREKRILDHVWASSPVQCEPFRHLDDLSDHRAVSFRLDHIPPPPTHPVFRRRVWAGAFCFECPPGRVSLSSSLRESLRVWDGWAQRVKTVWSRVAWVRPKPREHPWVTRQVRQACKVRSAALRALRKALRRVQQSPPPPPLVRSCFVYVHASRVHVTTHGRPAGQQLLPTLDLVSTDVCVVWVQMKFARFWVVPVQGLSPLRLQRRYVSSSCVR
jgi:hypothetical protein